MTGKPNIVLILVDDMGFADLGCLGSEIHTPNIDALAAGGSLQTAMYNCARCCPTRASLLTGLYPHQAGIGHMGADLGTPSYQGFLRDDAATIAEHLRAAGYATLMSGKWHVAGDFMAQEVDSWQVGTPRHPTPRQRGFDHFFGIVDGCTHYFSPYFLMEEDDRVHEFGDDFHLTDAITDKAIGMVQGAVAEEKPFFLYLAHAAPHWPLHAHAEDIARYDGVYSGGWDATRTARHEEMNGRGILQTNWQISPRDADVAPWAQTEHKDWEAAKMAAYAAMIDHLDRSVGRVVETLKRLDQFDDTLILFLSDNGGCAEFMAEDGWCKFFPDRTHDGRAITMGNQPGVMPGDAQTFQSYDRPWANVSNAPFRLFKHYVHEGGISTPLIAHWPDRIAPNTGHAACHVVDILPTLLEVAGAPPLAEVKDSPAQAPEGESLLPLLQGADWTRAAPIFFEHEGNAAVRMGDFKLVRQFGQDWELYDMVADRTELTDLAAKNAPLEADLQAAYADWEGRVGVLDWDIALPRLLQAWQMTSAEG